MANIITEKILAAFLKQAPEMRKIATSAKLELEPNRQAPFEYLVRAIIYQQLSGKAASTIHGRFMELIGELEPNRLLELDEEKLRSVGLSRQKASYVRNVASAFLNELQEYRTSDDFDLLSDKEIIELLTGIKGVGNWTAEMYLIFGLGRLDIFSATDLGIRKGVQIIYGTDTLPKPGEARRMTEHWSPYSTIGSLLCWRAVD